MPACASISRRNAHFIHVAYQLYVFFALCRVEDSLTLAEIEQARDQGTIASYVMKKELLLPEYPELHIGTDEYARKLLRNGNKLQLSQFAEAVSPCL